MIKYKAILNNDYCWILSLYYIITILKRLLAKPVQTWKWLSNMLLVSGIFMFIVNNLVEFLLILFLWTVAMQPMDTYYNNLSLVHTVFIISYNY